MTPDIIKAWSNAHHHPPEASSGEAETIVPGRVNDVVRLSLDRKVDVGFFKLDPSIIDKLWSDSHVDFIQ